VMDMEDHTLQSTDAILGWETGAHVVQAQLTPPRRHRHFGLRHTSHLEGRVAYLSAAATAQCTMEARLTPFQPLRPYGRSAQPAMGGPARPSRRTLGGKAAHRRCDQHAHHCTGTAHILPAHGAVPLLESVGEVTVADK
jgi:hypothetical protein